MRKRVAFALGLFAAAAAAVAAWIVTSPRPIDAQIAREVSGAWRSGGRAQCAFPCRLRILSHVAWPNGHVPAWRRKGIEDALRLVFPAKYLA